MIEPMLDSETIIDTGARRAARLRRLLRPWRVRRFRQWLGVLASLSLLVALVVMQLWTAVPRAQVAGPAPSSTPGLHSSASASASAAAAASAGLVDDPRLEFVFTVPAGLAVIPRLDNGLRGGGATLLLELVSTASPATRTATVSIEYEEVGSDTTGANDAQLRALLPNAKGSLAYYKPVDGAALWRTADGRLALPVARYLDSERHVVRAMVFRGSRAYVVTAEPPYAATVAQIGAAREMLVAVVSTLRFRTPG